MMKRIVCLLAALMLFVGTAHADAYQLDLTWESDLQGALEYLDAVTDLEGDKLEQLAEGFVKLANGLSLRMNVQDQWVYMALSLMDTVLLDVGISSDWDHSSVLSSLLPGHYLSTTVSPEEAAAAQQGWESLAALDWDDIAADLSTQAQQWVEELDCAEEHGNFLGDTYEGGVLRRCYSFDDQAVAQLVERLLETLEGNGLTDEKLQAWLGEDMALLDILRQKNAEAASANRFSYMLYDVYSISYAYMGSSLVVLEAGEQVMTLSYGVGANGWRLVWGYGFGSENIYINLDLVDGKNGGKAFALVVYQDPMKWGFRMVEPYSEYVLWIATGSLTPWENSPETGWTADVDLRYPGSITPESRYLVEVRENKEQQSTNAELKWFISGADDASPVQTIRLEVKPCEPMEWSLGDLKAISADDSDAWDENGLLQQLVMDSMQDLVITLFKLIPTQLLTMLLM